MQDSPGDGGRVVIASPSQPPFPSPLLQEPPCPLSTHTEPGLSLQPPRESQSPHGQPVPLTACWARGLGQTQHPVHRVSLWAPGLSLMKTCGAERKGDMCSGHRGQRGVLLANIPGHSPDAANPRQLCLTPRLCPAKGRRQTARQRQCHGTGGDVGVGPVSLWVSRGLR